MANIIILVTIPLLVAILSFILAQYKPLDKRRKGLKIITKYGWIIIIINLVIIVLSVIQFSLNEKEIAEKDKQATTNQKKRDLILKSNYDSSLDVLKKKFDTTNIKTVEVVAQTLGKYGFLFDSSQKMLIKIIKDSSKIRVIEKEDPIFSICAIDGIKLIQNQKGIIEVTISLCSDEAGSTAFDISGNFLISDALASTKFIYLGDLQIERNFVISQKISKKLFFKFTGDFNSKMLYIYLNGTYKNLDKTKTYSINTVYYLNTNSGSIGEISGRTKTNIIDYLKSLNIPELITKEIP